MTVQQIRGISDRLNASRIQINKAKMGMVLRAQVVVISGFGEFSAVVNRNQLPAWVRLQLAKGYNIDTPVIKEN
jgi:hypothetical protein